MGFRDELENIVAPAERVLHEDLVSLANMPSDRRERRYRKITERQDRFEQTLLPTHREKLDDVTISDVRSQLATARLFLHVASLRDDRAAPIDPDTFTDDEVQAAIDFDRYRAFDVADEKALERRIREKDEDVYEFVVEEVTSQSEDRSSVLDSRNTRIRTPIVDYLNRRYEERLERSEEAVALYIKHHGLPTVIERMEEAVDATADGARARQDVEAVVSAELDDLSERLHATLRDQERDIRSDIATVLGELSSVQGPDGVEVDTNDIERKLDRLDAEVAAVREERAADVSAIEGSIEELEGQRERIERTIDDLERTGESAAEQAASDAAADVADRAEQVVGAEVERLEERREDLEGELTRLQRERERLEVAGERLEDEHESLEDRIEHVTSSLPGEGDALEDSNVVAAPVARLYEVDFINRFDESMQDATSIRLPDGSTYAPEHGVDDSSNESGDERSRMRSLLKDQGQEDSVDHYPLRRRSRYTVTTSSGFGLFTNAELVVEAIVHSNLEAYAANGFDARSAGLDDLLDVINRATERAGRAGVPHLIGAASTTGWTDRIRELVTESEFSRTRLGTDVSLCLVDIRTGELLYDPADDLVHENRHLFDRAVPEERVNDCEREIRETYIEDPLRDTVRLDAVVDELGYQEHVVSSAFDRLVAADDATRNFHTEYGPYLVVDGV